MKIPQVSISKDSLTLNYSLDEHHSLYLLLHLEGKEGKCHNTCYNPYNMLVWYKALIFELQGNRRALTLLPILGTARLYHQRCKWKFSSLQQCDLFPGPQKEQALLKFCWLTNLCLQISICITCTHTHTLEIQQTCVCISLCEVHCITLYIIIAIP